MDLDADVMYRSLIDAARIGDCGKTLQLIRCGVDVNGVSKRDYPILEAARTGNDKIVRLLLENGAGVRSPMPFDHDSPLIAACVNSRTESARVLIEYGADINEQGRFCTPLIATILCRNRCLDCMELLLAKGADPNRPHGIAYGNQTPLMIATYYRDSDRVKLLLKYNADANIVSQCREEKNMTALSRAFDLNCVQIAETFAKYGADVNFWYGENDPDRFILLKQIRNGHFKAVSMLIRNGARVDIADSK